MQPLIFKPGWRAILSDGFMYLVGLALTVGLTWFWLHTFLGAQWVYGIQTDYLVVGIAVILAVFFLWMIISDSKLQLQIIDDQLTILEEWKHYAFPIHASSFSFSASHSSRTGSSYSLFIKNAQGEEHYCDLTPLGDYEFERLKVTLADLQNLPPYQIQTEEE